MIKSGFFNSEDLDRLYYANDFGYLISCIIMSGIVMPYGDAFKVRPNNGLVVNVGAGLAWFDDSYCLNTATYPMQIERPDLVLGRIDAIVLDFDRTLPVRRNTVLYIKGIPSTNPVRPGMLHESDHNQYPLAYITVPANAREITAGNITSMVGQAPTTYATSVLQQTDISELVAKWNAEFGTFLNGTNEEIMTWFNGLKDTLGKDPAIALQNQINDLKAVVNQTNNNVSAYGPQIESLQTKNTEQDASITQLRQNNTTLSNRIATAQNTADSNTSEINSLKQRQTIKYSVMSLSNLPSSRESDRFYFCY